MPTTELAAPIARATFPGYAKISLEPAVLQEMFLKVTGVIALITVSVSVGISAKSDLIVAIALGPNWIDVSPIVTVLALTGVVYSLQSNSGAVLLAMGDLRLLTFIMALQAAFLIPALLLGTKLAGAKGAAIATLAMAVIITPVAFTMALRAMDLRYAHFLKVVWRPLCAAALMYAVLELVREAPWQVRT